MTVRVDRCVDCGAEFEQERRRGRPRTRCDLCYVGAPTVSALPALAKPTPGDPPVRADGRCVECGGPRKLTKQARKYAGVALDLDPFCSSRCCRKWHGCEIEERVSEARDEAARRSADAWRAAREMALAS